MHNCLFFKWILANPCGPITKTVIKIFFTVIANVCPGPLCLQSFPSSPVQDNPCSTISRVWLCFAYGIRHNLLCLAYFVWYPNSEIYPHCWKHWQYGSLYCWVYSTPWICDYLFFALSNRWAFVLIPLWKYFKWGCCSYSSIGCYRTLFRWLLSKWLRMGQWMVIWKVYAQLCKKLSHYSPFFSPPGCLRIPLVNFW